MFVCFLAIILQSCILSSKPSWYIVCSLLILRLLYCVPLSLYISNLFFRDYLIQNLSMILKDLLHYLYVVFLVCFSFINCYEVHSMDEFSTQHKNRYSDNVKKRELTPPNPGWIDPFAMLGDSATQNNLFVQSDVDNYVLTNRLKKCESYMRRFINLFLRSITGSPMEQSPGWVEYVKLEFSINLNEFNILQEFGEHGECGDEKIELVSEVLSNILSQTFYREKSYYGMDLFLHGIERMFTKLLNSPEWIVVISTSVLFLTTAWMIHKRLYCAALSTFFSTIFIFGLGFTWIRLYEEKETEKYVNHVMHGNAPYHCQGKHLEWYEHMYYRMFGTDCHEFYKIRDVSSIVKVSPTDVLVETVSSMVIIPLKYLGDAYGNFIHSLTRYAPFWLQPFALIIGAAIPLLILLLLLTFLFKYRLSVSWTGFHFAPVLFHSREPVQGQTSTKYIEDLSKKNDTQLQSNTSCESDGLSENNKPLFVVMNMLGLKKLVSKTKTSNKKIRDDVKVAAVEDGKSDTKDSEEHSDAEEASENKQMEDLLVLLKDNTNLDRSKRRNKSISTVTDGCSLSKDSVNNLEDHNEVNKVSGGNELLLNRRDKQTEYKDKTA